MCYKKCFTKLARGGIGLILHLTSHVKRLNVALIKNTLKARQNGTKSSIAQLTGLSVATCGTILNELVATGEVIELEPDESSGGRPAKKYAYNADFGCVICLVVMTQGGIHSIRYQVVNLAGDAVMETTMRYESIDVDAVDSVVGRIIQENNQVQAIGIGIPGVVDRGIIGICDVPQLAGKPLGPHLEEKYGIPVTIQNDMNMTIYGLYHMQDFEEEQTFAVVTFPKGHFPGAGFIAGGRLLAGYTNFGGEVSFLPFGISREEQLRQLQTDEGFVRLAVRTITSIVAIINPIAIALTGELPRESLLEDIYQGCLRVIPEAHMPKLFVKNDTQEEYMKGMVRETLESLSRRLLVD